MTYCPECGGEMQYIPATKRYVCKSCGLSLMRHELSELRKKMRGKTQNDDEEERKKRKKEYLKWWFSKKK